ncbi:hypothetical protein [Acetobacter syzygii]|uniref:hypothetical protein n=1 Tax=Acetobacter syzygii TaxID=146476 RepID=UPI00156F260B|nr:hypothetical protein [Acetobacter syzygii]NSL93877.1 hypothetical protein [Acetobacter syzygii]
MLAHNPTNWPNPERPGVPMFPERSGKHHVSNNLLFWYSDIQKWVTASPIRGCKEPEDFAGDEYHGPVLTPAQIAELLAGERARCADECRAMSFDNAYERNVREGLEVAETKIRNLGVAL